MSLFSGGLPVLVLLEVLGSSFFILFIYSISLLVISWCICVCVCEELMLLNCGVGEDS